MYKISEQYVNLLGIRNRAVLGRGKNAYDGKTIFIEKISKDLSDKFDKQDFKLSNTKYKKIYAYGRIDINNSEDLQQISELNIVPYIGGNMHSTFDYNSGRAHGYDIQNKTAIEVQFKYTQTFNPITWFKYNHCLIGKPEYIIIYE